MNIEEEEDAPLCSHIPHLTEAEAGKFYPVAGLIILSLLAITALYEIPAFREWALQF